ncbi:hypothetical protein GXM_00711 [Nostoc sphaeroides CCNUC1]|uniref:Uncharacterized protein n=2 Tax=Nostoc sphaeroides TaxID=446679 RepID=A0A5P8VS11_9NOSO|nr:hypothetical protein GXM_00711 [Nostoc sphaeroides CCNUC1]
MTSCFRGCSASSLTFSFSKRVGVARRSDRIKHLQDKMLGR